jgi:RNA polymerase-binding protein DksA
MSKQVLDAKRQLLQARQQVLRQLNHLSEFMQVEIDLEPDEGDEEIVELDRNALVIAILKHRLQAIDAALRSIEEGRYGICARCGQPIDQERLQAKPDATLCVQCQREIEHLHHDQQLVRQAQW